MCCRGRIVARWRCLGCGPAAGGGAVGADAIKYDAIIAARFALASTAATAASGISLGGPPPSARDAAAGQLCSRLWNFHSVHSELHAVNAMGDGHFAISLAAYGAQTRPSMATFIYACAAETVALGAAAMLSSLCSGIWLPKKHRAFALPPGPQS